MKQMDKSVLMEIESSGRETIQRLRHLKQSLDLDELAFNLKDLGDSLVKFLRNAVERYHDTRWDQQRELVMTQADGVRILMPSLMETMMTYLKNINNHHSRVARDVIFSAVEKSINGIITAYKHIGPTEKSKNGEFLTQMDRLFYMIDHPEEVFDIEEFETVVKWIIQHSLTVGAASEKDDEEEISGVCKKILSEVNNIKAEAGGGSRSLSEFGNYLELLEQTVNGSLLRLVISTAASNYPLDQMIKHVLDAQLDVKERLSDDLSEQIKSLDKNSDRLFQLCHLCIFCTTDSDKAQKIRSIGKVLETLEIDLVPAVLQLYFNPDDPGAKSFVKMLRNLWKSLTEELSSLILSIVDPAAYSVILLEEMTKLAKIFKSDLYSQESEALQMLTNRLVSMAETGVDLAWKDVGNKSKQETEAMKPLDEDHPLVKAERCIWEVRAASKMLVKNIADLSLHQSLMKRIQVLVSAFEGIVQLLTEAEESVTATSNILDSLVTASTAPPVTTTISQTIKSNCISFRATRNLDKTAALAGDLRKEIYKLTVVDLTPFTPRTKPVRPSLKRKPSKVTVNGCILETPVKTKQGSRIVRRSSARLSSVISELSALSHELSICLENSNTSLEEEAEASENENKSEKGPVDKNTPKTDSLRRVALKNLTNKVVLTSANNLLQF